MTKKILFTVTNDLTYDQRMIRICSSLAQNGYQVELIGRKLPTSKKLSSHPFTQKRLACMFKKGKLFYLEYNVRLLLYLLFKKCDAICSIDLDTIIPGFLVAKMRGKAFVYDAHEYFTEVPEVVERPRVQHIWRKVEAWIVPKTQYAYTVCESIADLFEKKYPTSFAVIRNVPFRKKENLPVEKVKPSVILYQGALNEGRGLEASIYAIQKMENAQLWLAGEGDLSRKLRQLVEELDLQNTVTFLGYLKPEQLKKITPQATIGLNLLENKGLSYYYSLANKAFDYIQAEVPAIHMNFPEYQKLNAEFETALLIDDLKSETVEKAFKVLLTDQRLYQRLKENCKPAGAAFTWEMEEQKLLQFYKKVFHPK